MPYRVQFLDDSKNVLSEERAEWWSATNVFDLPPKDWPSHALTLRVLDSDGCDILTVSKDENPFLAS
jgi:hypothetical protein